MLPTLAGGSNYSVPVPGAAGGAGDDVTAKFEDDISRTIVDCEVNADQWTLMHRYNKAAKLLEAAMQVCAAARACGKLYLRWMHAHLLWKL